MWGDRLKPPKVCPVCGHDSIKPVPRSEVIRREGLVRAMLDVLAYRCGRGHFFLSEPEQGGQKEPTVEDR